MDTWGHIRTAYELAPGECVLVRPDGYVGATLAAGQIEKLDSYLGRMGIAPLRA
jgi:hypothetical protein